ncbi:hypothetical protein RhiJN_25327 [Ceratobasidium sp. AG-Ba]|nr:hypothetical protein RhiJN_25327 [Ceratobasidium sp. AG-Ba]
MADLNNAKVPTNHLTDVDLGDAANHLLLLPQIQQQLTQQNQQLMQQNQQLVQLNQQITNLLEQHAQVLQRQAVDRQSAAARTFNLCSSRVNPHLMPLPLDDGTQPQGFPETVHDLLNMTDAQLVNVLHQYGLPENGLLSERRTRLGGHIGVKVYAS